MKSYEELKVGDILVDSYNNEWYVKEKGKHVSYLRDISSYCEKSFNKEDYNSKFTLSNKPNIYER